jgi:hypothetical protein
MSTELPAGFRALEPWVAEWAIPFEGGRFEKRVSASPAALDAFVHAIFPRIDEIIGYLNGLGDVEPNALAPPDRRLFDLALMCMEGTIPSDLNWEITDIADAWPPERIEFLAPSALPAPANR